MRNIDLKKYGIRIRLLAFKKKQLKQCPVCALDHKTITYALSYKKTKIKALLPKVRKKLGYLYLKVDYGKHKDNFGRMETFDNSGCYNTIKDCQEALDQFTEKDLIDYIFS